MVSESADYLGDAVLFRMEMSVGCCAIEPFESPLFFGIFTWHRSSKVKWRQILVMTARSFISSHRNCRRFLAATHHTAI